MINLSAWAYAGRGEQVSEDQIRRWTSGPGSESKHSASWHSGGCFLHIASEKSVEDLVHWGRQLSLICDCDLLAADEIDAVVESAPPSTAALLAALYARHGDDFVQHLHGAFAIVLYDHQQEVLKAWTDHFGVKRIVFRDTADGLGIANDLRLLMKLVGRAAEIDQVAIVEYLQYSCIPAPRTIYKGFNRLEPGHQLRGRVRPESRAYWDVTFDDREGGQKSEDAQADALLSQVRRAVKSTLSLSEDSGQIGCFLSGGTDSSSITGICGELTGKPPRSYSIGFDDPRYNEIEYARIAARSHNCDHHEYFVKPHDILSLARLAGQSYDEPFGNSSIIPAYYCARLAAQDGVTHMLAGDGGDEVFGGNERYVGDVVFQRYDRVPSWFRRVLFEPAVQVTHSMINSDIIDKAQRYLRRASLPLPERLFSYSFLFSTDHRDLFTPEFGQALNCTDT
jgi:asparagine synthase (glutamine-hydrolysing)